MTKEEKLDIERGWFVSSAGYDRKALDLAQQSGILVSRVADLKRMDELLQTRARRGKT